MKRRIVATLAVVLLLAMFAPAGVPSQYRVLAPITHQNLTIFPIVGGGDYDTGHLLTLDEGVRSGAVLVTEAGGLQGLIRPGSRVRHVDAEVNRLVLVNNSDRPLLLLAGEVVTGGKQDRVIGADRLVPPKSGPIDLSVFCVEPGRWIAESDQFQSVDSLMAQPSVRIPAMAANNQREVWDRVASAQSAVALAAPRAAVPEGPTTSYARTMQAPEVRKDIDLVAADYASILRELRNAGAKGVVVAINGKITWADVFASTDLLQRYWQKLVRSYAAEAITTAGFGGHADQKSAQEFIERLSGNREVIETEPGLYRRAETTGDGYKVFTLTALTPKADFEVHLAKMAYQEHYMTPYRTPGFVR